MMTFSDDTLVREMTEEECWNFLERARWVRIVPTRVTGRRFTRAAEPDRYNVVDGGPTS